MGFEQKQSDGVSHARETEPAREAALLYFQIRVATQSPDLGLTFHVQPANKASLGMYAVSADSAR